MNTQSFLIYLSAIQPLTPECRNFIIKHAKEEHYTKNQIILSEGQIADRLWFVQQGFIMGWYNKNEEKKPYLFWTTGHMMVNIPSFFLHLPSRYYIEIIETATLLSINNAHIESMLTLFPEMHTIICSIIEDSHNDAEKKTVDMLTLEPSERYNEVLQLYPELLQKTSVENIAAYLGISRKTLNRIRKTTLKNKSPDQQQYKKHHYLE
jgi:CRP-like cAMP-binding protein